MADFQTFDLGRILQTAAALRSAQAQTTTDTLRNRVLAAQAQQAETEAANSQGVNQTLAANPNVTLADLTKYGLQGVQAAGSLNTARASDLLQQNRQLYVAANRVANSPDPVGEVKQNYPQFAADYDRAHGHGSFDSLTPDQIKTLAAVVADHALTGLVDPDKQFQAARALDLEKYKQGEENSRNANTQSSEDARNAARIASENKRAGVTDDGSVDPSLLKTAQMIATYRMAPPTAANMRTPRGMQLMGAVSDIDPTYDATQYGAKSSALKSLMSGKDGQTLDQVNTAVQHLTQLKGLLSALNTGDIQLINQARQAYQTATGNPAPTNASVVANMAAGEVNKVVTGGPGAEGDRDLSRAAIQLKGSPGQQQGALDNIIGLMAGRLNSVKNRFTQAKLGNTFDNMLLPETKAALSAHAPAADPGAPNSGKVLTYDPATGTFK